MVLRQATLPVVDVALDADGDALAQLLERIDPRRMRMDVERAPLLAAHVGTDAASGQCHLVLLNHHLVCDHVTLEFIVAEIRLMLEGRPEALPQALPYRNFVAQSRLSRSGRAGALLPPATGRHRRADRAVRSARRARRRRRCRSGASAPAGATGAADPRQARDSSA